MKTKEEYFVDMRQEVLKEIERILFAEEDASIIFAARYLLLCPSCKNRETCKLEKEIKIRGDAAIQEMVMKDKEEKEDLC